MLVEIKYLPSRSGPSLAISTRTKRIVVLCCDVCGNKFERKWSSNYNDDTHIHVCDKLCWGLSLKEGGLMHEFHLKNETAKKRNETTRKTLFERYGVSNPSQIDGYTEKVKQTMLERYGITHIFNLSSVREKALIGVKSNIAQSRREQTTFERYGVRHTILTSEARQRTNSPAACSKRHETMKRNKSYTTSITEDKFAKFIISEHGDINVERQFVVNNRAIDLYISSINTYVQFDDVYWHGLDRSIDLIKESASNGQKRDIEIFKKWCSDRQQDEWFSSNNLRLVRITDQEFKLDPRACLLKITI